MHSGNALASMLGGPAAGVLHQEYGRAMTIDGVADVVWGRLRATRWDPPGAASGNGERRRTYVFALEQAEQMFRAAAGVGPATRPLLVFYGLSQAARAIAAAASTDGEGWRLQGHGISCDSLHGPLADTRIRVDHPESKGSFVRVSKLLDSPLWDKSILVTLNTMWDFLPENRFSPLHDSDDSRRTPLYVHRPHLFTEPHPLATVVVANFPPWVVNSPQGLEKFTDYLSSFPEARGYHSFHREGGEPDAAPVFNIQVDGWGELFINWELPPAAAASPSGSLAFVRDTTRRYVGSSYFFPALPAADRSLHPLMTWWAVLYTLSMLARYQPAEWASSINVDASRHAVQLERILDEAIGTVPNLIAEAIDQVANPRSYLESVDGYGPGIIDPSAW